MEKLKIDKPIRLIELFAGIGSQAKALTRLGAEFEHYRVCEFDKYAISSYNAVHGTDFVTSDITKINADDLGIVDTDKYCYIMTYSFPCQDLSLAGKGKGMAKGKNTRSGLLWEVERLLNECVELPQILLMENVTQVHGTKNKEHFDEWLAFLESKGYKNYWKDLNAKNFGIPQNRNRCFMVSVLGEYSYEFPEEFPLALRLKDMLEDSVDEKFCIKNFDSIVPVNKDYAMINGGPIGKMHDVSRRVYSEEGISPTIHTCGGGNTEPKVIAGMGEKKSNGGTQWYLQDRIYDNNVAVSVCTGFNPYYKTDDPVRLGYIPYPNSDKPHQSNTFYDANAISPTLDTCEGGNRQVKIAEPLAYDEQNGYIRKDGTVGTLTTDGSSPKHNNRVVEPMRIRKLTPKECWRLMGFDDADFDKAAYYTEEEVKNLKLRSSKKHKDLPIDAKVERVSNTQLYKQAGNSIVVDVLCYIFREML